MMSLVQTIIIITAQFALLPSQSEAWAFSRISGCGTERYFFWITFACDSPSVASCKCDAWTGSSHSGGHCSIELLEMDGLVRTLLNVTSCLSSPCIIPPNVDLSWFIMLCHKPSQANDFRYSDMAKLQWVGLLHKHSCRMLPDPEDTVGLFQSAGSRLWWSPHAGWHLEWRWRVQGNQVESKISQDNHRTPWVISPQLYIFPGKQKLGDDQMRWWWCDVLGKSHCRTFCAWLVYILLMLNLPLRATGPPHWGAWQVFAEHRASWQDTSFKV